MIDSDVEDGITILRLRHGRANALDLELCAALTAEFRRLRDGPARAVVLTGQGRIFCAGVDLKRLSEGGAGYIREFLPALHLLYETVFQHPKPVVAAINGHAIAGGAVLACCADARIMATAGGRIGVTELLVGVPFPALAFEILRFSVPSRYLAEFALSGATYDTDAALEQGWINDEVEPASLIDDAVAIAREMALLAPAAFAQTKRQIRQPVTERMAASGAATDNTVTNIWTAPETLAHIRDYVARTLNK